MKSDNSSWQTRARAPPSAKLILRRLLNAHDLAIWARQEGFADLRPSIWHLSVAMIKERANRPPLDGDLAIISPSEDRRVVRMGELIALAFDAPKLSKRHDLLRRGGCSWDFVAYHPHVSFTPFDGCFTREVRPFDGPLIFGPEVID